MNQGYATRRHLRAVTECQCMQCKMAETDRPEIERDGWNATRVIVATGLWIIALVLVWLAWEAA